MNAATRRARLTKRRRTRSLRKKGMIAAGSKEKGPSTPN